MLCKTYAYNKDPSLKIKPIINSADVKTKKHPHECFLRFENMFRIISTLLLLQLLQA